MNVNEFIMIIANTINMCHFIQHCVMHIFSFFYAVFIEKGNGITYFVRVIIEKKIFAVFNNIFVRVIID